MPKTPANLSLSSKCGTPVSGSSHKKSSISFFVLGLSSLGPDRAATEPNRSFPIFPLFPIFGRTQGLLVLYQNFVLEAQKAYYY